MGELVQTTSMYVHRMCPTDACRPTHSPHAFLQALTQSDDDIQHTKHWQVCKIRLHITQHLITGMPSRAFIGILLQTYVAVLNTSA